MENSGLDDVDLSPKTRVWSWASEGRKRESRKEPGESVGVELGGMGRPSGLLLGRGYQGPFLLGA